MKKILITLLLYSFCRGAVIVETKNGADPTTNGFTYTANGTPAKGFGTEFGEDYWFVQSTRSIYYLYTQPPRISKTRPVGL